MATSYDRKGTMMKGKAGKSILSLLLMMLFMFSVNLPAVMAEEVTDEEVTPVEMVTPSGSATVAEVVEESGSGDVNVVEDQMIHPMQTLKTRSTGWILQRPHTHSPTQVNQ